MLIYIYIFDADAHQWRECRYVHRQTHQVSLWSFVTWKVIIITNFPPLCQFVLFGLVATLILGWNIGRYYQVRFHSGWYSIPVVVLDLCSNPEIDRKVHSSQNWGNSQLHKSEIGSSWINHPFIYQFAMENCLFIIYWSNMISWIYLNGSWMIYLLSTGDFPFNFSWRKLRNPWGSPVVNGDCRTPVFSFSVKGEPT